MYVNNVLRWHYDFQSVMLSSLL